VNYSTDRSLAVAEKARQTSRALSATAGVVVVVVLLGACRCLDDAH